MAEIPVFLGDAMKVLLMNPPVRSGEVWVREGRCQQWDIWGAPFAPFSLAMISTAMGKEGHETRIIDSGPEGMDMARTVAEAQRFNPDLAILSTASPTIESDLAWFAPLLREACPKCRIAAIGIHVTALPERALKRYPALDYVVLGEPEDGAATLVRALAKQENPAGLANIAAKDRDGSPVIGAREPLREDLDSFGYPDWAKIDFAKYPMPIVDRPFSLVSFSRGCPYGCKYCAASAYNGKKPRRRSISSLLGEIEFNLGFNVGDFLFWTELMTLDDEYLNEFLDAILKEGLEKKIRWVCNSRVDCIRPDTLRKMRRAGCWQIAFGLEFGSDEILRIAGKGGGATVAQGRKAVTAAAEAGIAADGHFIMGYPGETEKHLQMTIDYACSLPLTFAHFYAAVPFPGSELYSVAVKNGWCQPDAWESYNQDAASLTTPWLKPETVNAFIGRAYRSFYSRPGTVMRILKIPKTLREYANIIKMGFSFMRHFGGPM